MKRNLKITIILTIIMIIMLLPMSVLAITTVDNGIMYVYPVTRGFDASWLRGFDIKGYITTDEDTGETSLISSTYGNYGYHIFLNVNGNNGEMEGMYTGDSDSMQAMFYNEIESDTDTVQNIDGIDLLVTTEFINNGEQLKIIYTLKNTTSETITFSLGTCADVQIDGDDRATIQRLEDGSGIQLWTEDGNTGLPVQFVLYAKDIEEVTDVDNIWIGRWRRR